MSGGGEQKPAIKAREVVAAVADDEEAGKRTLSGAYGDFNAFVTEPRVAASGRGAAPVLLTYHDLGLNHASCFDGFLAYAASAPADPLRHFRVVQIDAPGQGYNAPRLPASAQVLDLDRLAEDAVKAMDELGVERAVLFGVGAGASVLLRVAARHPARVAGAVLLSPSVRKAGWTEWGAARLASAQSTLSRSDDAWTTHLMHRYFSHDTFLRRAAVTEATRMRVLRLPRANVWPLVAGMLARTDVREEAAKIRCPTLVMAGENTREADDAVEAYRVLPHGVGELIHGFHRGVLGTEETPRSLLEAFVLFLRGLGHPYAAAPAAQ